MIVETAIPPGLVVIVAGLLLPLMPALPRALFILGAPLIALAMIWSLPEGPAWQAEWLGMRIVPVQADALSRLFGTVFAIMAGVGGLYALNQKNVIELSAAFIYAGSALGVVFAGDLLTVFAFWEMMAIFSTVVVWMGGDGQGPGLRYAIIHFLGGVILMAGIAGQIAETGSTAFTAMEAGSLATWLILAAFLINTGAPPLSAWLPDAYPASSWSGMVFLSAFTTKTAVYTLIRGFPGEEVLVWFGLYMVFYGIVYAILENDMRRILAYSICNQVGFMVCAVGIGTELALNGAAAHAFAHIIYKALLLMSAGSVLYMTGKSLCTDLGGLFRTMPVSCLCGIVGALSISSFPLTSGYVAKSLISSAAGHEHMFWVWMALAAASAGVFLHAGIKFPWFVFFQKDSGLRTPDPPWNMQAAMILFSVVCIALGIWYTPFYALLPFRFEYEPYTAAHMVYQFQLLLFSGLAFFLMLGLLKRTRTITLDWDWLWRGAGLWAARRVASTSIKVRHYLGESTISGAHRLAETVAHSQATEMIARTRPSGSMAFWMTLMLLAFLVLALF